MTTRYLNLYDLDGNIASFDKKDVIVLRPSLGRNSPHEYTRCQLAIVVTPDKKRVFVAESEYESPQIAYEADTRTISALAERFDLPELRKALALRVPQ